MKSLNAYKRAPSAPAFFEIHFVTFHGFRNSKVQGVSDEARFSGMIFANHSTHCQITAV
jgi:hypothetical protein